MAINPRFIRKRLRPGRKDDSETAADQVRSVLEERLGYTLSEEAAEWIWLVLEPHFAMHRRRVRAAYARGKYNAEENLTRNGQNSQANEKKLDEEVDGPF